MARLSMDEVQKRKKYILESKEILKGRNGEHMFNGLLEYIYTIEAQHQENEQLQEQAAKMLETIQEFVNNANILAGSNESVISEDSTYWKFRKILSGTPTDYHNHADVSALKKAKEALITLMGCNEISNSADIAGEEAIAEIDKVLRGVGHG